MLTSVPTLQWIESLAEQELHILGGNRTSIDLLVTKQEVLKLETVSVLRSLSAIFGFLVNSFNYRVENPELQIRILREGEPMERFSLSRNQLRMTLYTLKPGVIQIQCEKLKWDEAAKEERAGLLFSGAIEAYFGSFFEVHWNFLETVITPEQIARHYLTEFIQSSRLC